MSDLFATRNTRSFSDIFPDEYTFDDTYRNNDLVADVLGTNERRTLYYLLYARYGNSHIASTDENRFIYDLASIIYAKGGSWIAKVKIQKNLRDLIDNPEELMTGTANIHNTALNPGTDPSTQSLEELQYINQQEVNKVKFSKLSAYGNLYSLLVNDVTSSFIEQFKRLFITNLAVYKPFLYATEDKEEE